ncbi:MAG: response regulator [Candidatus Micrarchaeota archaeon]
MAGNVRIVTVEIPAPDKATRASICGSRELNALVKRFPGARLDAGGSEPINRSLSVLFVISDKVCTASSEVAVVPLIGRGHDVKKVETGAEALDVVKKGGIDVVLCPIDLKDMDGIELVTKLMAQAPNLRVVMMATDVQDEIKAIAAGVGTFLVEPVIYNRLIQAIELH